MKSYCWAYFDHHKNGYMCKTCETFFGDQGCPISQGKGAWSHYGVVLRDNPGKKFRRHNKSKSHIHVEEITTQVRIEKQERRRKILTNCTSQN